VRKVAGALGLRGFERIQAANNTIELRWCIPLPRKFAQVARDRIEKMSASYRDLVVPKRASSIEEFEASFADFETGRLGYMAGGAHASLRRMLIVDTKARTAHEARKLAKSTLEEVSLAVFAGEPSTDEMGRHVRAVMLARYVPEVAARLWTEAEAWPPPPEELAPIEEEHKLSLDLVVNTNVIPDPASAFAILGDRPLGFVRTPSLYVNEDLSDNVATICERGLLCSRWDLLAHGQRPRGLVEMEDLKSGGAAFVFTKLNLDPNDHHDPNATEYKIILSNAAFDRLERFAVERDAYGALAPLSRGLSDAQLAAAISAHTLTEKTEILFPDALPASLVVGVRCRTLDGQRDLQHVFKQRNIRIRTAVG
jgi:hypothetical protein